VEVIMIVGFIQYRPVRYDVPANVAQVEHLLSGVKADLLVLPELANSGYMYASPETLAPHSEPADGSGRFLSALQSLAASTGALIVTGLSERTPNGLYNSAVAVEKSGVVALYRKTHLFADEQDLFLPGDTGFNMFETHGVRIGMMVCFDWYFPESARTLALRGAQIIAHPSNLVLGHCQTAMVTRSLENRVFSITSNRWGVESLPQAGLGDKSLTFTGASQVLTPLGIRVAQGPVEGDSVACAEIDPAEADNKRPTARNHLLNDRRPEMYG
jgi:predicted amidohydrolase